MSVYPIHTTGSTVTIGCSAATGGCGRVSTDVEAVVTARVAGHAHAVRLTCPTCGASTSITRVTPDRAVDDLAQPDVQAGRAHLDVATPGEWTLRVAVMWRVLDDHHVTRRRDG